MKETNIPQEQKNSELKECEVNLSTCEKERDEFKDKYFRSVADFDNFKRRSEQERFSLVDMGKSIVLLELLAVVDDFERAIGQLEQTEHSADLQGVTLIKKELEKVLKTHNVTELQNYAIFDPEVHEALVHLESEGRKSGAIVEVVQKGYRFKDNLLRPAKVTVAK